MSDIWYPADNQRCESTLRGVRCMKEPNHQGLHYEPSIGTWTVDHEGTVREALLEEIAERRHDPEFMQRVAELVEENSDVLEAIRKSEGTDGDRA